MRQFQINSLEEIQSNCSVTVEAGYSICGKSILSTSLQFFCNRCLVYNCVSHGVQNFNGQLEEVQIDYSKAIKLIRYYQQLIHVESDIIIFAKKPCGKNCFYEIKNYREFDHLSHIQLPLVTKSFIEITLGIFGFNPCKIVQNLENIQVDCKQVFAFIFQQFNLIDKYFNYVQKNLKQKPKQNQQNINQYPIYSFNILLKPTLDDQLIRQTSPYTPCNHPGKKCSKLCHQEMPSSEKNMLLFCDKFCSCFREQDQNTTCKYYRVSCQCLGECSSQYCSCRRLFLECDPQICKCTRNNKFCRNVAIQFNLKASTFIGASQMCQGLGLFAMEPILKDELITTYLGESLTEDELEIRQYWEDKSDQLLFSFDLMNMIIEARYFANEARFSNHSMNQFNAQVKMMYSQGDVYLAFYAERNIKQGEEILICYGTDETINKQDFPWINSEFYPTDYKPKTRVRILLKDNLVKKQEPL